MAVKLNRRHFLKTSALVSIGAAAGVATLSSFRWRPDVAMMSAAQFSERAVDDSTKKIRRHSGVFLSDTGEIVNHVLLNSRAHAAEYNRFRNEGIFFSRRPGDTLFITNPVDSEVKAEVKSHPGKHFYGHGVLSSDGELLFATENDIESGDGIISLRSAHQGYQTVKEIPSYGIGPHELALLPDGKTLVVANGGLRTHPEKYRVPQNISTMKPNLSFIDWQSGELLHQFFPRHHKMGIRHLSVNEAGTVFSGVQYKGAEIDAVPLVLSANLSRAESGLNNLKASSTFAREHKQYTASVCALMSGEGALVSCPKSNQLTYWDDNEFVSEVSIKDVAGVCRLNADNRIYYSSGTGEIGTVSHSKQQGLESFVLKQYANIKWDNHLVSVI